MPLITYPMQVAFFRETVGSRSENFKVNRTSREIRERRHPRCEASVRMSQRDGEVLRDLAMKPNPRDHGQKESTGNTT